MGIVGMGMVGMGMVEMGMVGMKWWECWEWEFPSLSIPGTSLIPDQCLKSRAFGSWDRELKVRNHTAVFSEDLKIAKIFKKW